MLIAAALSLLAAQTPPAASTDLSPEDRAAALAAATFEYGCLLRLGAAASAADFASGSDTLGAQLKRQYPAESAAITLDGLEGRGCRVRYMGPRATRMWSSMGVVPAISSQTADGGGCTTSERSELKVRAVCVDTAVQPPRRAELVLERSSPNPDATVTASLVILAP